MAALTTPEQLVQEFHTKLEISPNEKLTSNGQLMHMGYSISKWAKHCNVMYKQTEDQSWLRLHLILEEVGELIHALENGDEVMALDAIADLLYVTYGTAAVYNLPATAALYEVHASNMTKEKQQDDADGHRVRSKGPNYQPPNLKKVLDDYRNSSK